MRAMARLTDSTLGERRFRPPPWHTGRVFERFTERARHVVVYAQEEARSLRHNYIGTEHILLGLLREQEGLAARVLNMLDVTLEDVRGAVTRIVGAGEEVTAGQIPFTPRGKKVLEISLRESLSLGHNYIGSEHILLGLVREDEGVASRILLDLGADSERIRNEVLRMLSGPSGRTAQAGRAVMVREGGESEGGDWEPGLQWDRAHVRWEEGGAELLVPLHLERRAHALLIDSPAWRDPMLAGVGHELDHGRLRLSAPALLESVDPRRLRTLLDEAVAQAHERSLGERERETSLAETFLAALREEPAGES